MRILFHEKTFYEYLYSQNIDKKTLKRLNELIKDIASHPFDGLGNPEPLIYELYGFWSRRINLEDRLIYKVQDDLIIVSCF